MLGFAALKTSSPFTKSFLARNSQRRFERFHGCPGSTKHKPIDL